MKRVIGGGFDRLWALCVMHLTEPSREHPSFASDHIQHADAFDSVVLADERGARLADAPRSLFGEDGDAFDLARVITNGSAA